MTDLAALTRTVSPTARRELAHIARHQDTVWSDSPPVGPPIVGVHQQGLTPATRDGLLSRDLITIDGNRVRLTDLGRAVLEHLEVGA